jgi:hypothetical protein
MTNNRYYFNRETRGDEFDPQFHAINRDLYNYDLVGTADARSGFYQHLRGRFNSAS